MNFEDFRIGLEFYTATGRWRCTDIGTRTVIAIPLDTAEMTRQHSDGTMTTRRMSRQEAQAQGWFAGPPYGVVEHVFDDYDLGGCTSVVDYILSGGDI